MKRFLAIGLMVLFTPFLTASAEGECEASNPAFVCGLKNAEDLVRLPGTPWVVASQIAGRQGFGPLSAVHIDTHEVRRLFPDSGSAVKWDRKTYPDCDAPPDAISSHGLNVRRLGRNKFRLFAVNHGGRESVEIIDVTIRREQLHTLWRGCIRTPDGIIPNGVVPLARGGVAVAGGKAAIWWPGRGWTPIEGIESGNGIEVSRDNRWLYIAQYMDRSVVRVPVDGGAVQTIFQGDFHTDNLRWGEDDRLYVTGHRMPDDPRWDECMSRKGPICDAGFAIAQITLEPLASKEFFRSPGLKGEFGVATTALQIGNHFWVGTFIGDRVAVLALNP